MQDRLSRALLWTVIGAAPGVVMVFLAQFLIEGEMELTFGTVGIALALAGALLGFLLGFRRIGGGTG